MPKLIDAHTHAQFAAYQGESDAVIKHALSENIWVINAGTQKSTSEAAIELANQYDEGVYATVGLHPLRTDKSHHGAPGLVCGDAAKAFTSRGEDFDVSFYGRLARSDKVVGIGECGLDYYRLTEETKPKQAAAFEAQINLAHELNLPLVIHCRDAFADLFAILKTNRHLLKTDFPGISHFFTGTEADAQELMNLGFFFSFGGVLTFTQDYDGIVQYIGLKRILLETDAPYVAPEPHRGKRNEPVYVKYVAERLAAILGTGLDEVAEVTTANTRKVFSI